MARASFPALLALLCAPHAAAQHELHELSTPHPATRYGWAVATDGQRVAVSDDSAQRVWVHEASTGALLYEVTGSDLNVGERFGAAVALRDGLLVVGAPRHRHGSDEEGAVYVYDAATGQELHELLASDPGAGHWLGYNVSVDGDIVAAGAPLHPAGGLLRGAAYLFDASTGAELRRLTAADGADEDRFGAPLAIDGGRVAVAAIGSDDVAFDSGSVYVFDVGSGAELYELHALTTADYTYFGRSLDLSGDRLAAAEGFGVQLYDPATGQHVAQVPPPAGALGDFGRAVALGPEHLLVGLPHTSQLEPVHVFDRVTGAPRFELWPGDADATDQVGDEVAIAGTFGLVAAWNHDHSGAGGAGVWIFTVAPTPVAYCSGDGGGASCPCANPGASGAGCANSSGSGGRLLALGSTSLVGDDLALEALDLLPGQPALLFAGQSAVAGGDGAPFGDGLRCAGQGVVRLGVDTPDAGGAAGWGPGLAALGGWAAGDARYFQAWYRDPSGPCGAGFNLTQGLEAHFAP